MTGEHPAEYLRALPDASPFGIVAPDSAGIVRLWSLFAAGILRWTGQEAPGMFLPAETGRGSRFTFTIPVRARG